VLPSYQSSDIIELQTAQLPYDYKGLLTIPADIVNGIYSYIIYTTAVNGCDSIIYLQANIGFYSDVEGLFADGIKLYPNPVKIGGEVTIDIPIDESDKQDLVVEVFNMIGEKVFSERPFVYPIKLRAFNASGMYIVKIKSRSLNYEGKILVK
jgi:hypothetical protein